MDKKVAFFDFDGTLTNLKESTWDYLNEKLKVPQEVRDLEDLNYKAFVEGKISFEELANEDFYIFSTSGLKEQHLIDAGKCIEVREGVEPLFKELNKNGVIIYITSGNMLHVINSALGEDVLKYVAGINATEYIFDEKGNLQCMNFRNADTTGKVEFINKVLDYYSFEPNQAIFFGDGKNDQYVYLTGIDTICLNPSKSTDYLNPKFWNGVINTTNLIDILPIALGNFEKNNIYKSNYEYSLV